MKVYAPQDGTIRVHQSRVTRCPSGFPAGYYWYGTRRSSPGRPPKWVDRLLSAQDTSNDVEDDESQQTDADETVCTEASEECLLSTDHNHPPDASDEQETVDAERRSEATTSIQTRTRKIIPPKRLMLVCSGRAF